MLMYGSGCRVDSDGACETCDVRSVSSADEAWWVGGLRGGGWDAGRLVMGMDAMEEGTWPRTGTGSKERGR